MPYNPGVSSQTPQIDNSGAKWMLLKWMLGGVGGEESVPEGAGVEMADPTFDQPGLESVGTGPSAESLAAGGGSWLNRDAGSGFTGRNHYEGGFGRQRFWDQVGPTRARGKSY